MRTVAKNAPDNPFGGIVLAGVILVLGAATARAQWPATQLLRFDIDEKIPPRQLLPPPPRAGATPRAPITDDLSRVPEINFQEPIMVPNAHGRDYHDYGTSKASIQTALQMAKINLLNKKKRDLFLETLLEARPDLAGLPFVMGDAGRWQGRSARFPSEMEWVGTRNIEPSNRR